jgi:hypothetical protein
MKQAQWALAVLIGVLLVASATLTIFGDTTQGWVFGGFGLFGFIVWLAMVVSEGRPPRET